MRQVLSRQVLSKGALTAAAASSLLSIATGAAVAHTGAVAEASHSPGVLSGNSISVPLTLSPNVCGNSVGGGAALNPSFGNTCATTSGSDGHHHGDRGGHAYDRHLSPEHAEAFERYLQEREGRHDLPGQRGEEARHGGPRAEESRPAAPRHAAPRHEEPRHGKPVEEECDDHPQGRPVPEPAPVEHPAPSAPQPAPAEEAPRPLPAPAPVVEGPTPAPPQGGMPVTLPAAAPAPESAPPADQPSAVPAGDTPVHAVPLPAPAPFPVQPPARAASPVPVLAETGAGQAGTAALLASALVLGGAVLYRRSRTA
ncbi:chaplin [Streptomyces sp. NPDC047718]|uniref:chaplin n=1 Tax=Streptomyces sp. NPDC047718 TaxID=3155479 RepID=UPI0033F151E9